LIGLSGYWATAGAATEQANAIRPATLLIIRPVFTVVSSSLV